MKKKTKSRSAAVPQIDPYLEGLMAKLLDRLVSLETKMDTVMAQTAVRPSGNSNSGAGGGNNNNRGNNSGNGNSHQSKPFQNPDANHPPRRERILFEAICADCHQACEVPFRPSAERAVYCKECFSIRKSGGNSKSYPVPTPSAAPAKMVGKMPAAELSAMAVSNATPKSKTSQPAKKAKKKK